jgi:hypothetical protein
MCRLLEYKGQPQNIKKGGNSCPRPVSSSAIEIKPANAIFRPVYAQGRWKVKPFINVYKRLVPALFRNLNSGEEVGGPRSQQTGFSNFYKQFRR